MRSLRHNTDKNNLRAAAIDQTTQSRACALLGLFLGVFAIIATISVYTIAAREGHSPLFALSPVQFSPASDQNQQLPARFTNISYGGRACDTLMSANIIPDYKVKAEYEDMHIYSKHVLQFPPPRANYFVDVPAKSGNHNWKGLFYRLWMGKAPNDFEAEAKVVLDILEMPRDKRYLHSRDHMWLLVRNPYVRLLSVYLKKGLRCKQRGYFIIDPPSQMLRNYGILNFEQYLIALTNHIIFDDNRGAPILSRKFLKLWRDSGGRFAGDLKDKIEAKVSAINTLTTPIPVRGDAGVKYPMSLPSRLSDPNPCVNRTSSELKKLIDPTGRVRRQEFPDEGVVHPLERAYRLCTFDHHFCVQACGMLKQQPGRVKVLRLEEQSEWYSKFVECFGIRREEVVGEEWMAFEGKNCFYTPTDDCNDALTPQNRSTGLAAGGVHPTSAVDVMNVHYTPLAAALAYYLYEYDFQRLGYKKWDGVQPFEL